MLQQILQLLENDALIAFAPALITFLTNVQKANSNPLALTAAYVQLQGDLVGAEPQAIGAITGQLAAAISTKIQALLTQAQSAPVPTATVIPG